jgi:hypothetical protein
VPRPFSVTWRELSLKKWARAYPRQQQQPNSSLRSRVGANLGRGAVQRQVGWGGLPHAVIFQLTSRTRLTSFLSTCLFSLTNPPLDTFTLLLDSFTQPIAPPRHATTQLKMGVSAPACLAAQP